MIFAIIGVSLSLVLGLFSVISWQLVAVLVAVSLGIPSLILTHEKITSEERVKPKEEGIEQEQEIVEEKVILRDETLRVSRDFSHYFELELKRGDNLKGEISSDAPIDIYFVDKTNFEKWDKGRVRFDYEYCAESVLETKIDYEVPKKGAWYVLIENNGRKSAVVKIYLYLAIYLDNTENVI